ncbi:metallophosphoesterase family protein [Pigmentiphaga kullae]|uniref:3',5'-cyclic AMP phosphodiesterase CpdA n=1 Tax=Pigmentiphaga kullae TaxID=151784 RepID=A0A4Q7NMM4_9BURK|nr:metallophosphoesterase [Pigmentiphaga kullae]RZS86429.1 3',5'-cyclic AMP phosphodiesterase CpdA [Pigmentiphaga kullae]
MSIRIAKSIAKTGRGAAAALALAVLSTLAACGGGGDGSASTDPGTPGGPGTPTDPVTPTLRVGILPDTQGGDSGVALHPMKAILDLYARSGVNVVLAVGDLVENGTPAEYALWRGLAEQYKGRMTILPIMGNHDPKGIDQDWYDTVEGFIPADAQHMPGSAYKNYALVRDNVLFINISYGWLERAYDFVESMVKEHRGKVDHIILQTHNSFAGNRYGLVRENLVDGSLAIVNDVRFREAYDKYRKLFAEHDVIYVSGHEHHYARSLIRDDSDLGFQQIISGDSAYKGYETRFGEHERIQNVLMHKVQHEDTGFVDANASIFTIQGGMLDYRSYFATHSVARNEDGPKELATPQWKLLDRFVRSTQRCEKVVFPGSVPADIQRNSAYDPSYRTSYCASASGHRARLLDGTNRSFNRYDTRTRGMSATPGYSYAGSNMEMLSMMYRYMFISDESFSRNLNNSRRARLVNEGTGDEEIEVRATTIDLKKLVALNWRKRGKDTVSDVLWVSGIAGQTGTYIDPWGRAKDITTATGLPGSYGDGSESGKLPVRLPAHATRQWELSADQSGDAYVLEFALPEGADAGATTLARRDANGKWIALAPASCISKLPYQAAFLSALPADVDASCAAAVGYDATKSAYWARVDKEGAFAVVTR